MKESDYLALPGVKRARVIGGQVLLQGDCLEVMPGLGNVDAVVTDPPYGIGAKMVGGTWAVTSGFNKMQQWDAVAPVEKVAAAVGKSHQAIVWGGQFFSLPVSRCWLVWNKIGSAPKMSDAEIAWTSMDAPTRLISMHSGNGACGKEKRQHPTQKPVALMKWCLGFLLDAETILDPFMGSGTTIIACQKLGRMGIGIEIDPDYFDIACKRVEEAARQPDFLIDTPTQKPQQENFDL